MPFYQFCSSEMAVNRRFVYSEDPSKWPKVAFHKDPDAVFQKLMTCSQNEDCFDCKTSKSTFVSYPLAIFVCHTCAKFHEDQDLCWFVKPLKDDWSFFLLATLVIGGNYRAQTFFEEHGWIEDGTTMNVKAKHESQIAKSYREVLWGQVHDKSVGVHYDLRYLVDNFVKEESCLAREKFPHAKSISSSQLIEDKPIVNDIDANDPSLHKFSGSSSVISQDELLDCGANTHPTRSSLNWMKTMLWKMIVGED